MYEVSMLFHVAMQFPVAQGAVVVHLSAAVPAEPPRTCRLMGAVILWGKELQLDKLQDLPKKTTNIQGIYAKH